MVVRKTERVREMAAAIWRGLGVRRGGGGRGRRGAAGTVLGVLALAASVGPAVGQGHLHQSYIVPKGYQPVAVAYLAAPYKGSIIGQSKDFMRAAGVSPGTSIYPRFLKAQTAELWEGIPFGLFKGNPSSPTRLMTKGDNLTLGGDKDLDITLYAFLPENAEPKSFTIRTHESDAWWKNTDRYSVFTDTTFFLEVSALPPFEGAVFACVNKRSNAPVCKDSDGSQVIEDPFEEPSSESKSSRPALLMVALGGPPDWLTSVMTDICVEGDKSKLPKVEVPTPYGPVEIALEERYGNRWCSRVNHLNFIAIREVGLRIDGVSKTRLDSRYFEGGNTWKMLADTPRQGVERIVIYPPAVKEATPPAPEVAPSKFELVITGQPPEGEIKKLWYRSLPTGTDDNAKCEVPSQSQIPGKWGNGDLILAAKIVAQSATHLVVTEPQSHRAMLKQPLALIAEAAKGRVYCGVAAPAKGQERQFTVALLAPNADKTASTQEKAVPKVPTPLPPAPVTPSKKASPVLPAGPPVTVIIDGPAKEKLQHSEKKSDDGVFSAVDRRQLQFTLPPETGFFISKCDARQLECRFDEQHLELLPKAGGIPGTVRVTVDISPLKKRVDLTILREGPALLTIQHAPLKGKTTDLVGPGDKEQVLPRPVDWSPGDKLRVLPADPEFQKVSEITVDGTKVWPVEGDKKAAQDDKDIEISLKPDGKVATLVVKTADRLFSVPVTVSTSPKAGINIKIETRTDKAELPFSIEAQAKAVTLDGIKPDHTLTVELQDRERLEVATMVLRGGKTLRPIMGPTLKFERSDFQGAKLALNLDVSIQEAAFTLPDKFRLQPVVQIGKRELLLKSCKVELDDFLEGSRFLHKGGYTEVTLAQDKRAPKTRTYAAKIQKGAPVCSGLEVVGQAVQAAKLNGLRPDGTVSIPVRRSDSRVFVGIVSLSPDIRSKEPNWRAALEALGEVFDAGAKEGKYLWGAIYGPQGQLLVTSGDTADYAAFNLDEVTGGSKMDSLTGEAGPPFASLVTRVAKLKEIADVDGNVDTLVVADEPFGKCGWTDTPFVQGSRTAFVRLTSSVSGTKEIVSGVRVCERDDKGDKKGGDKTGAVVAEVEVVPKEWSRGAEHRVQLSKAIAEAAKGFSRPVADSVKSQPRQ